MARIQIMAEQPNATLLIAELRTLPELRLADVWQVPVDSDDGSLANADYVSILIDIAVGMISAGAYDLVRAAIDNARKRGPVTYEIEDEDELGQPDHGNNAGEPDQPAA